MTLSELFGELHCHNFRMYQVFVVDNNSGKVCCNSTVTLKLYNQFGTRYATSQTVGSLLGSDVFTLRTVSNM